jgi:hypothetical protein
VSTSEQRRPEAVTRACLIAGGGAVVTLSMVFAMLSDWGSLEIQEQVEVALEGSSVPGMGADQILEVARIVLMAIAVFAVAGLVLSVFTARGDRSARIGLTVLAAGWMPVALVFGVVGVLLSVLGAVTLALLWKPESRRWFAVGSGARDLPSPPPQERPSMSIPPPPPPGYGGYPPYGSGPPPYGQGPPAYGPPAYGPPPYGSTQWMVPERRPGGVTAAAVVTLVAASLAALASGFISLAFLLARDSFEEGVASSLTGMTDSELSFIASFLGWYFVVCALLSVVAIVLAILLLRDRHRVRVPLVVMSAITAVLALGAFPAGLLWSAAAISVIIMLFAGRAGAWFDLRNHRADQERASY